jgi:hypothetical protein
VPQVRVDGGRPLIVTLIPADEIHGAPAMIGFRAHGRRKMFMLPLGKLYQQALITFIEQDRDYYPTKRHVRRGLLK